MTNFEATTTIKKLKTKKQKGGRWQLFSRTPPSGRVTPCKNLIATFVSVSSGHVLNQSIVVQFTSPGYMRHRTRKLSPTGDMQRIMCRFERTRSMKN